MSEKKSFILYNDWFEVISDLSDESLGVLFRAVYCYHTGESLPAMSPEVKMAFSFMKSTFERDKESYMQRCKVNKENGKKGGRPKRENSKSIKTEKTERLNKEPKKPDNDNDSDNDSDNDNINTSTCVDRREPFGYQSVVNSFNSICTSLPKVKKLTDFRRKRIKKAKSNLSDISFEQFFKMVEASDFLTGRSNDWTGCCFDWILSPNNLTKIIEGNYTNKTDSKAKSVSSKGRSCCKVEDGTASYDINELEKIVDLPDVYMHQSS